MKKEPTLDYVVATLHEDPGVYIKDIDKDTLTKVITNSGTEYTIRILDHKQKLVEITGNGNFFKSPTKVFLSGSVVSNISSILIVGWIGLNWCIEVILLTREEGVLPQIVVTSTIRKIFLDGIQIIPIDNHLQN